jgi:uncharacterized damage-inducible protein DinB
MSIADSLIPELDHELATTRRLLERVPDRDAAWKPHPKSMGMGELAQHIANIVRYSQAIFAGSELDFASPGAETYRTSFASTAKLVELFDRNVVLARQAIGGASDSDMREMWTLRVGPRKIFGVPRVAAVRSFILGHLIHHRGQLSVYLRLRDVPLPPIYGPSADEGLG